MPAHAAATMKNSVMARSRTARADRLKLRIGLLFCRVNDLSLVFSFCISENLPEAMRDLFPLRQVRLSTRQRRYVALGAPYRRQRRRRERLFARRHLP